LGLAWCFLTKKRIESPHPVTQFQNLLFAISADDRGSRKRGNHRDVHQRAYDVDQQSNQIQLVRTPGLAHVHNKKPHDSEHEKNERQAV